MSVTVLLAAVLAAGAAMPTPPTPVGSGIPAEPGTITLPDALIFGVAVADLDADGSRELVRLVRGVGDQVLAEVWGERPGGWAMLGEPIEVVPASRVGLHINPVYLATPVRMLVRRIGDTERVTIATQPHFEEIDVGEACCLLLHDLVLGADGRARLVDVAGPSDAADALLVIDLDGDGVDELLVWRSLPPIGDVSYPVLARVHRWAGDRFAVPTVTELPVGSGDSPVWIGDTDGRPGDEAAIVSSLGPPGLFRISMAADDRLTVDAAGVRAEQAVGVPLGGGRGVAVFGQSIGIRVAPWPAGGPMAEPAATSSLRDSRLLGVLDAGGEPRLAVQRFRSATVDLLPLTDLAVEPERSISRSWPSFLLSGEPMLPFTGLVDGGLGRSSAGPVLIHSGRLAERGPGTAVHQRTIATLAGVASIAAVGSAGAVALLHQPFGPPVPESRGGPLLVPDPMPLAWVSVAPAETVLRPEADDGAVALRLDGAVRTDDANDLVTGPDGFVASLDAPPGSRIHVLDGRPASRPPHVVGPSGMASVRIAVAGDEARAATQRIRVVVLTPAGHAHRVAWDVTTLDGPPPLEVEAGTRLGSADVGIRGVTLPHARVSVDGRRVAVAADGSFAATVPMPPWPTEVSVVVDDAVGHVTRTTVTGVGLFDYRGLPVTVVVALVAAVGGVALLARVPRTGPLRRRGGDDDAELHELGPD